MKDLNFSINIYPQGHFVILSGDSGYLSKVEIVGPLESNPFDNLQKYEVDTRHFINSILIGVSTYDANFIVVTKE